MAKNDEIKELIRIATHEDHEKLHELDKEQYAERREREAIKKNNIWWVKKLLVICAVMWSAIAYIGKKVGSFLYDNSEPIKIGVDAAITAWRAKNGQ